MKTKQITLENLLQTIKILRGPDGCPWDQKQTGSSILKYIKEESEELFEAIHEKNNKGICEEIGDLLFTILMLVEIKDNQNQFTLEDVLTNINEKLIRRHPHVFTNLPTGDEESLRKQWQSIKLKEKEQKKKLT